ncbi:endoplasmic reticulum membrane sensor NFE2L1a isoform X2 [Antennarius striatus]|uniref:endoplasmic reticulum membrane sensor NFE2L1a isoform X2 n=1 Tax=Antennarius striatus TaxID=241820 RepID=UPI0035B3B3C6
MQYLKKYFMEGLIQMAILLSLCGVRVDVGLPPSWHEMILGPTSALTQTQFHNLHNHLEDGHSLHPKSVDLDGFFTARRLLGWVHSLDRLQVPHAELETWLVQREPDPVPLGVPDQTLPVGREPPVVERDRTAPPVDPRPPPGAPHEEDDETKREERHHVLHREEQEDEEDLARMHSHDWRTEGTGSASIDTQLPENEVAQTSFSLQECLRLLQESFPHNEPQLQRGGDNGGEVERLSSDIDSMLSPVITTGDPSLDLDLNWQELLDVMEPEDTDVDMMASFDLLHDSIPNATLLGSETSQQSHESREAEPEIPLLEDLPEHGLLRPFGSPEPQPRLSPLTPSAELDDHSSARNTTVLNLLKNDVNPSYSPPDHTDGPSEDFLLGLNAEDDSGAFDMNLLTRELVDTTEGVSSLQHDPHPEDLLSHGGNYLPHDLAPSAFTSFPAENCLTQDHPTTPPSFLFDDAAAEDEDRLLSPLGDLLDNASFLNEIRLDLALEEGFSPELAARLDEEGYLYHGKDQQESGKGENDFSGSSMAPMDGQDEPRQHEKSGENEDDSDSGLSLDFSNSHASPCASEASLYSSSPSSCISTEESTFSEDAEEGSFTSDMEAEVSIKQEQLDEEELGAVGGGYSDGFKTLFPPCYKEEKLLDGLTFLGHISHDHTYNQPWEALSSSSMCKMPTKPTKSSLRHINAKPYHPPSSRHMSGTKTWSRDERRARALQVPFSNEMIVNLPVEEFNDLLASFQLSEEQLTLVRDIRRRGKNKIAAQNCRKKKMDVLLLLNDDVSRLMRHRSRLLREKQEALRNLQEMKRKLGVVYQEVFSRLRDEEGRPLDAMEYLLQFEPSGSVMVAPRQQGPALPLTKSIKKQTKKK